MSLKIPHFYSQKNFENKIKKIKNGNITELDLDENPHITKIPYLPNLKILKCGNTNISNISLFKKLEELECWKCPNITEILNFPNLRLLNCSLLDIETIPPFEHLEELICFKCPNITEIPYFPKLRILDVGFCTNFKITYFFEHLEVLQCENCLNITEIPYFANLKTLHCSNINISSIPFMKKLEKLECWFCANLLKIPNFPNLKFLKCDHNFKNKMYNKNLEINNVKLISETEHITNEKYENVIQYFQGKSFQNTYRTYELLIF